MINNHSTTVIMFFSILHQSMCTQYLCIGTRIFTRILCNLKKKNNGIPVYSYKKGRYCLTNCEILFFENESETVNHVRCKTYQWQQLPPINTANNTGMVGLAPKWVRLAPNWDKSGTFSEQIQYILHHRAKMY